MARTVRRDAGPAGGFRRLGLGGIVGRYPPLRSVLEKEFLRLVRGLERKLNLTSFPVRADHLDEIYLSVVEDFICAARYEAGFLDLPPVEQQKRARRFLSRAFYRVYRKEANRRARQVLLSQLREAADSLAETIGPHERAAPDPAMEAQFDEALARLRESLTPLERAVVEASLEPEHRRRAGRVNFSALALALGLSRKRVRQVYLSAMRKYVEASEGSGDGASGGHAS